MAYVAVTAQQRVWTLDDCMRYAVENSPSVKKQQYTLKSYQADRDAATASFFPTANASVGAQYNYGRSIDPETNTYNNTTVFYNSYNFNTEIPVFTGGQLINQWLMSHSNVQMGRNGVQKEKDDLSLKTMQAYMDVLYYEETRKMAAQKLAESRQTLYKTKRQEELGVKSQADVAQFEAQVAADDYSLIQQENLWKTSTLVLKQCMNFPSVDTLNVDTTLQDNLVYLKEVANSSNIYEFAIDNNPTALQAAYKLKESKYQYRVAKGQLLPTLYFGAGYNTNFIDNLKSENPTPAFSTQFKNNRGEYIAFSLRIPLFNGLSKTVNLRKSRNNLRIAQETQVEVLRQLQNAVEQSVLDREGYAKESFQMEKKVESDSIAYMVTLRKYEEGLMSSIDVQTTANTLLNSRASLLQKKLMYLMKCRLVDYYKGEPLIREEE